MTGPMALLWAGVSSEGGLEISARAQTGRGGQPYPPRDGFLWGGTVGPGGGWLCPRRREALGCWGWAAALTSGPPAHCPLGLPGAPSSSGSKLRLHPNGPSRAPSPQEPHTPPPLPGGSQWWLEAQTPEASVSHKPG